MLTNSDPFLIGRYGSADLCPGRWALPNWGLFKARGAKDRGALPLKFEK